MKRLLRTCWYVLSLRCEEADRVRSLPAEDTTRVQRFAETIHRVLCRACRRARRELELLRQVTESLTEEFNAPERLDDEARLRILDGLDERS